MKNIIIKLVRFINSISNIILIKLNKKNNLAITSIIHNDSGRFYQYYLTNNNLLSHKEVLNGIYNTLMSNEKFKEFGKYKVILVSAIYEGEEFNFHPNILLTNNTSFEEYYKEVINLITTQFNDGYKIDTIQYFKVLVWNMDSLANKHIKIHSNIIKNKKYGNVRYEIKSRNIHTSSVILVNNQYLTHFTPLNNKILVGKSFATMDIETMEFNKKQVPVVISICNNLESKIFIIDNTLDIELAINKLWKDFFNYISLYFNGIIFVHNLGSFDGFFIYKYLSNFAKPEDVSTIIDDKNKFIQITLSKKIIWKDSFRIFPVSLNDLCNIFGVEGKISNYIPEFNNLSLFTNQELLNKFIDYSIQDSLSLYLALKKAQDIYLLEHNVDITSIYSTSTLSLKIFRSKFLKVNIPSLKGNIDYFIRKGYFGGATDYYRAYITNAKYYDVNSLYPFAMCKPMPFEMIYYYDNMNNIKLEGFFGFCLAEVYCPNDVLKPILPYRHNDKTIYPTGYWIGVYFSEELKAAVKLGYKVTLIKGYEFSKIDLFTDYVNFFYLLKKNSTGAQRFIAKMHLNQLYGYFGRRLDLIETLNVYNTDIILYAGSRIIKSIIQINDEISTILMHCNINDKLIKKLNTIFELNLESKFRMVKTNVAIASAVTAYARIHMIPFKLLPGTAYTDTDSIITTDILPENLIGKDIGLMKDELDNKLIIEAYILGAKQYGYKYLSNDNNIITKSTFSGVSKDSLTFEEIIKLFNGESLVKLIPIRFFKYFKTLDIIIKSTKITIVKNSHKKLVNNIYLPINIFNLNNELDNRNKLNKFINKIYKVFKYIFKY